MTPFCNQTSEFERSRLMNHSSFHIVIPCQRQTYIKSQKPQCVSTTQHIVLGSFCVCKNIFYFFYFFLNSRNVIRANQLDVISTRSRDMAIPSAASFRQRILKHQYLPTTSLKHKSSASLLGEIAHARSLISFDAARPFLRTTEELVQSKVRMQKRRNCSWICKRSCQRLLTAASFHWSEFS